MGTVTVADGMTEAEVGSLFEHVKRYLPSFHTEDFMTDDTNTFWKGYNKAMKRNAKATLINRDLFEPFFRKMKEICLVRNRNVFVAKYTLILGYLRKNEESVLSSYMENSWSDRVDQWAAFGWLGSCVNTSMLCERFHKTPKHEMLEGKANKESGLKEGKYRLQQHHKAPTLAVNKYHGQRHLVCRCCWSWNLGSEGQWKLILRGRTILSMRRGNGCAACPYAYACSCPTDVRRGISCTHVHAALLYAAAGRRSQQNCGLSLSSIEVKRLGVYVGVEEISRSSPDIQDGNRDLLQGIEMEKASIREDVIKIMRRPTEGAQMSMEQTLRNLERLRKTTDSLADNAEGATTTCALHAAQMFLLSAIFKLLLRYGNYRSEPICARRSKLCDESHCWTFGTARKKRTLSNMRRLDAYRMYQQQRVPSRWNRVRQQ
ncbi:hypothetical protein RB195_024654 [Necator americanus]|uniref:SWIM-type domain-containing protein n=1 Tax=Necator americanus TaxID=51031 RepID=A0ABR1EP28_NECAM